MISVVTLVAAATDSDGRHLRKRLKRGLEATARIRDADVQRDSLATLAEAHAVLRPLVEEMGRQRDRAADAMRPELERMHVGRHIRRLRRRLFALPSDASPEEAIRASLSVAAARVARRLARRGISDDSLHRARLALKKLRYMSEALQPRLPPAAVRWHEDLRQRQKLLGDLRDREVLVRWLRDACCNTPEQRRAVQLVSTRLALQRRALLRRHVRSGPLVMPRLVSRWFDGV